MTRFVCLFKTSKPIYAKKQECLKHLKCCNRLQLINASIDIATRPTEDFKDNNNRIVINCLEIIEPIQDKSVL